VLVYRQKKIDLSRMMVFRQCNPAMQPGYYETAVFTSRLNIIMMAANPVRVSIRESISVTLTGGIKSWVKSQILRRL